MKKEDQMKKEKGTGEKMVREVEFGIVGFVQRLLKSLGKDSKYLLTTYCFAQVQLVHLQLSPMLPAQAHFGASCCF